METRSSRATTALYPRPVRRTLLVLVAALLGGSGTKVEIEEGEAAIFEPLGDSRYRLVGRIPASAWPQLASTAARASSSNGF